MKQEEGNLMIKIFNHNDGGRKNYFKGTAGDCVVRSITIATDLDYKKVYDDLFALNGGSPRDGVHKKIYHDYILGLGFDWVPTMTIGSGCKVHLHHSELPKGVLITRLSGHLCAVIDGCINDIYDCSRDGKRCVYGYYESQTKKEE